MTKKTTWAQVLAALLVLLATSCDGPSKAIHSAPNPTLKLPLTTSWSTKAGTWAIVAMGELTSPNNTFWEMMFRSVKTNKWKVVTPLGVADNGGLVATHPNGEPTTRLVVGFEPSQALTFSPIAASTNNGASWSPGELPGALVREPDVIAEAMTKDIYALVRTRGGTLLKSTGNLSSWSVVTSLGKLNQTGAGRSCDVTSINAVAVTKRSPYLAVTCLKKGALGILVDQNNTWSMANFVKNQSSIVSKDETSVPLLVSEDGAIEGVISFNRQGKTMYASLGHKTNATSWSIGAPSVVPQDILGTSDSHGKTVVFVTANSASTEPGTPPLPPGTLLIASPHATRTIKDALRVTKETFFDTRLTSSKSSRSWVIHQHVRIPIQIGSST